MSYSFELSPNLSLILRLTQGALAEVMLGDLEFVGEFSFNKRHPTAPNPVLSIDGLGVLGLPLSTREAAAIKTFSKQAPFGKADKTIVDKSVRDTWEIDASKVTSLTTFHVAGIDSVGTGAL